MNGTFYTLSATVISSFLPIIIVLALFKLPPIFSAGLSTLLAALFFALVLTVKGKWHELKVKAVWPYLLGTTILIAIYYYGMLFFALQYTVPGNAAILVQLEMFISMLILGLSGREEVGGRLIVGGIFMFIGAGILVIKENFSINPGDFLLILAQFGPPFGNYFAKKAREKISSSSILFTRSIIGGSFLIILSQFMEIQPQVTAIYSALVFILISGFVILGFSKILWIEGCYRISVTKAVTLAGVEPAITLIFAYLILNQIPTGRQILGFIPVLIGLFIITRRKPIILP